MTTLFWATAHGENVTAPLRWIACRVFVMPGVYVVVPDPGVQSPNKVLKLAGGGTDANAPAAWGAEGREQYAQTQGTGSAEERAAGSKEFAERQCHIEFRFRHPCSPLSEHCSPRPVRASLRDGCQFVVRRPRQAPRAR